MCKIHMVALVFLNISYIKNNFLYDLKKGAEDNHTNKPQKSHKEAQIN